MDIVLTRQALTAMLAHAAASFPQEACGILLGEGSRITAAVPARNVHPSPLTHFEIDPQALIDAHRAARGAGACQVIGYYHSHPNGPPAPSPTDQAMAAGDGRVWAIIAGEAVRLWRDERGGEDGDGGFAPLSFTMIES